MLIRSSVALLSLTFSAPVLPCVIIDLEETERELPPDIRTELKTTLRKMEVPTEAPALGSTLDGDRWSVSIEHDGGSPEPGVLLSRLLRCTYEGSWSCTDQVQTFLEYRGERVAIDSDVNPSDARGVLSQIEALIGQSGLQSMREASLDHSDLQRIRSLDIRDTDVRAHLESSSDCGEYLWFRRECTVGACRLRYMGYYYAV